MRYARDFACLLGVGLVVSGVGMIHLPSALIVLGASILIVSIRGSEPPLDPGVVRNKPPESSP